MADQPPSVVPQTAEPVRGQAGEAVVRQAGEARSAPIESLRALAALAVVFSHIYFFTHPTTAMATVWHRTLLAGGFGVWVFFGLTGYLLYLPFARMLGGEARGVDYRSYVRNRVVRIVPLYWAAILVYGIAYGHPGGVLTWARYFVFTQNFSRSTLGGIDGPAWSLVLEVQFYVLLPFLALGVAALARRSTARAAIVLAALGVAAFVVRWLTVSNVTHIDPMWQYNLPSTFFFFIPGMLLALVKVSWRETPPWMRGPLADASAWLAATVPLWLLVIDRYNWDALVGAATFLTIGACVLPLRPSPAVRVLAWKPLAVLGTASYSLYLWHLPLLLRLLDRMKGYRTAVDVVVLMPLFCLIALVSYAVIEAPFLRLRTGWQRAGPSPASERY